MLYQTFLLRISHSKRRPCCKSPLFRNVLTTNCCLKQPHCEFAFTQNVLTANSPPKHPHCESPLPRIVIYCESPLLRNALTANPPHSETSRTRNVPGYNKYAPKLPTRKGSRQKCTTPNAEVKALTFKETSQVDKFRRRKDGRHDPFCDTAGAVSGGASYARSSYGRRKTEQLELIYKYNTAAGSATSQLQCWSHTHETYFGNSRKR